MVQGWRGVLQVRTCSNLSLSCFDLFHYHHFRFVPNDRPKLQVFDTDGIIVDVSRSAVASADSFLFWFDWGKCWVMCRGESRKVSENERFCRVHLGGINSAKSGNYYIALFSNSHVSRNWFHLDEHGISCKSFKGAYSLFDQQSKSYSVTIGLLTKVSARGRACWKSLLIIQANICWTNRSNI